MSALVLLLGFLLLGVSVPSCDRSNLTAFPIQA